ncbi:PLP-dependent aminotransferase family protein [Pseudomonas koreensis]|uniref:MocR-like pyridoxine biosynthesis transcription factor PdxR n=1 Tax=Pseudomonas koreensis TaxID=198620 RepID=UPI00286A5CD2|nr:PLP-dependent aminotransferase family protein [Pseudomonas koreensis]
MSTLLNLSLDRTNKVPLAEQIRGGITNAIDSGVLLPGARLPSWRDLASQLGVARGTVRVAYERLLDAQLIVSSRTAGTRVAARPRSAKPAAEPVGLESLLPEMYRNFSSGPGVFQMGIPALDCFPMKQFARIRAQAVRAEVVTARGYPDPRGESELRREIAAHLAISRSIECLPSQIIITSGFTGALGLALRVLRLEGKTAWMEDPGFPLTRLSLQTSQVEPIPVPIDGDGMDVHYAMAQAPHAALAIVTPGQQAPLGPTLSLTRRLLLLEWAAQSGAWIIEDDYLGELQLTGRAAPALSSLDREGRVLHIGSFSKTLSPTLRLGFIVVPVALASAFVDAATCLAPAPGPAVQNATAEFMKGGHYMRHLRRMKRVYATRRDALFDQLKPWGMPVRAAGLAMLLELPEGTHDVRIAMEARRYGLTPAPLTSWYSTVSASRPGLLLGVASATEDRLGEYCDRLRQVIDQFA